MPQWPQFGLKESLGRGPLDRETGEAIDGGRAVLPFLADGAFQAEDLCNARPLVGKVVSQVGAGGQGALLKPSMSFVAGRAASATQRDQPRDPQRRVRDRRGWWADCLWRSTGSLPRSA